MAHQVEHTHLSRTEPAEDSTGNLYGPSLDPANAAVTGGWSGRRRTAQRLVLGTVLAGAGAVVFADTLKSAAPAVTGAIAAAGRAVARPS